MKSAFIDINSLPSANRIRIRTVIIDFDYFPWRTRLSSRLADDACNTAIESFQTDRLLRIFHSCYFHYSE